MRTVFLCLSVLCSTMICAQNVANRPPDELSNKIVIHYECTKGVLARGKEINVEHQTLADLIGTRGKLSVKNHRPVFPGVVRQMISNNWTEAQWRNMKSTSGRQKTMTSFNTANLSTTVSITVDGDAHQVAQILKQLNEDAHLFSTDGFRIVAAEPVKLFYTTLTPNDPRYAAQWAHRVTGTDQAWDTETGNPDVVIAVIDSGIDPNHEDLKDNVYPGSRDFVDVDTQLYQNFGYTLIPEEDYIEVDNDPTDYNGHGTHVSGIIGAVGNNGKGVAGVCHSCSIMSLRAGFSIRYDGVEYGTFEDAGIANAIIYAADNGADVINMSFGGQGSLVMKNAVEYAHAMGVILVAAVGNSAEYGALYPAGYDHVLGVAASTSTDKLSWSSNFGEGTDLVAPGESIVSTVPVKGGSNAHTTGYRILDGTSMASPYVAGVAGLIKSKNPTWTAEEVIASLFNTAKNIDATNPTRISQMGYGRVNVAGAVNDIPTPNVVLDDYTITALTGNQDGNINPAEAISIVVNLRNTWATANAVTVTLTSSDPYVSITQATTTFESIGMNENKTNATAPLVFTANATIPDNHLLALNLTIEYDGKTTNVPLNLESFVKETFLVPANYPTIQAAIDAASNGDEILVSPGTYYENINFQGKRIAVVSLYHSTGDRKYIESTIIDGSKPVDPQKASTVTINGGEDASTILSGFTIQGGSGTYTQLPENSGYNCFGGGVLCLASSPVLKNLIVRNNTLSSSNGSGGGIMVSHGRPLLENLEIRENKMSAGLYILKVNNPLTVMARNVNVTKSGDHHGIYISRSDVRLQDISVEGSTGFIATGLFLFSSSAEVDAAIIHGNNKGVDVHTCNRIIFRNTIISNNTGGAIRCTTTDLELINTTVAGNHLNNHYGGAGVFFTNVDSKLTLFNSILHGNLWTELNTGIVRKNQISFLNDGGTITAAYSNIEGGQEGVKYFSGSSQIVMNWLSGNINSDPLFFKPEKNDFHLSDGSPSRESGVATFQHNGRLYVDLKPGEFEGDAPNMGAEIFNSPYVKASFKANRTQGNAPLSVQFTNESYGFKVPAPNTWLWDFGDGTTSADFSPTHEYNEAGEYTVMLKAISDDYADEVIQGAYIRVFDSDTLYVSTSGSDITGTGNKTNPYKTIQHGINQASDEDVVIVANGTYTEHLDFGGKDVRVSSYYMINNDASHIDATIIDGSNNGQVAIFSNGETINAGLYGLTLQHGYANGTNVPTYEGGGLYIIDSSPTLMDLIVKNNKSNSQGGGIFVKNGSPWMERVTVKSNQTVDPYASGGGLYMQQSQSVIKDCSFVSNSTQSDGGGILLGYNANPDMLNVMMRNNMAGGNGGGIYISSDNPQLKKMLITNNHASHGGGIFSSASNSLISSTVVAANTASMEGGAIYYLGNSANPKLENVTLYNNSSPIGNEITTYGSAKVVVTNSIVWNTSGTPISGTAIITYSDVSGGHAGTGNINVDPKLLDPANDDFSLDKNSPCIDSGNPSISDPDGSRVDMGAMPYDRPVIIGVVSPIVIAEDDERYLYPTDLFVVNTRDDYPGSYTVVLKPGENYTTSGGIIRPDADFFGTLVIPVAVSNNVTTSQDFHLTVVISPVNDAPVITSADEFNIEDSNALTLSINDVEVTDIDTEFSALTFEVLAGTNYTVSENTIQAVPGFSGELQVSVRVGDGSAWSEGYAVIVRVTVITDVNESINDGLVLYPNPASTGVYLTNIAGKAGIQMYSVHGRAVQIAPTSEDGLVAIDVSHLVEGHYLLRIETREGITWRKVIVVGN